MWNILFWAIFSCNLLPDSGGGTSDNADAEYPVTLTALLKYSGEEVLYLVIVIRGDWL